MVRQTDIVIIGAGVVGCAVARQCALDFPDKSIVVLEKHGQVADETSGHNSAVIHSGIHEDKPLKSKLARRGNKLAMAFASEKGVPLQKTGMIIAIPANESFSTKLRQAGGLVKLIIRGLHHRISFFIVYPGNIKHYEPDVHIVAGILVPNVYSVDPVKFTEALQTDAEAMNVVFQFASPVTAITEVQNSYQVTAGDRIWQAGAVINAAGLYADEIARLAGFDKYNVHPWRGEYYLLNTNRYKISRPVNPVMPRHHGKGIQTFRRTDGRIYIGPNSYPVDKKDDYTSHTTNIDIFVQAANRFLNGVQAEDLEWSYAGMRPKLSSSYKESDFIISKDNTEPVLINLVGIESPGLTASMAIAESATKLLTT